MQKLIIGVFVVSTLVLYAEDSSLEKRVELLEKALKASQEKILEEKMQKAIGANDSFNQQDFLPNIAFIANMSAVARDISNKKYREYAIDGL